MKNQPFGTINMFNISQHDIHKQNGQHKDFNDIFIMYLFHLLRLREKLLVFFAVYGDTLYKQQIFNICSVLFQR